MQISKQKITPCLWFDTQAEEAAQFYTAIFEDSEIDHVSRYSKESAAASGKAEGAAMTVSFRLAGQKFVGLNGGPQFDFTEAISFQVSCESQEEVDYLWEKLSEGGEEGRCGWLKDQFGVSWQIIPTAFYKLMSSGDAEKSRRVMNAMMQMTKFDIEALENA